MFQCKNSHELISYFGDEACPLCKALKFIAELKSNRETDNKYVATLQHDNDTLKKELANK